MNLLRINDTSVDNITRINEYPKASLYSFNEGLFASAGLISSIQYVEVMTGPGVTVGSASITAVDLSRSVIIMGHNPLGSTNVGVDDEDLVNNTVSTVEFNGTTQLIANRQTAGPFDCPITSSAWVVEFNTGKVTSIQRGRLVISSSNLTGTYTLSSSVDTSKAVILNNGHRGSGAETSADIGYLAQILTFHDSSTIRGNRGIATTNDSACQFTVVEFASGVLNSVQRVTVTGSGAGTTSTVTISSVDTSQSICLPSGMLCNEAVFNSNADSLGYTLSNSTTVSAIHNTAGAGTAMAATITEFAAGTIKSVQRGTITLPNTAGSSTATATVNSVDTTKSIVICTGASGLSSGNLSYIDELPSVRLLNSTTVQAFRGAGIDRQCVVQYELIEFN